MGEGSGLTILVFCAAERSKFEGRGLLELTVEARGLAVSWATIPRDGVVRLAESVALVRSSKA